MKVNKCTAKFTRYKTGRKTPSEKTKSGFRKDFSKPSEEGDSILVEKGQPYWWIKRRYCPKTFFNYQPTQRDLTFNDWDLWILDLNEKVFGICDIDGFNEAIEEINTDLEDKLSEIEEKMGNMEQYEGLTNGSSYMILEERRDHITNLMDSMASVSEIDDEDEYDEAYQELTSIF